MRRSGVAAIIIFALVLAGLGSWSCSRKPIPLTIGTTAHEANSLIFIAQGNGYFAKNGLDVAIKVYSSGKVAMDAMRGHEVDMATGTEYAFVGDVMDGADVRMIGVINRNTSEYLVGRADKGVTELSHLRGKKVGVPMGSRPEFALGRFLYLIGADTSSVTLVNVPANQSVDALVSGRVDAVATWQPYIDQIRERLGDGMVVWSVQNGQPSYNGVMCPQEWTVEHPDLIKRFLKALDQAEAYSTGRPEEAKSIVRETLGYSDAYVASVWQDHQFSVSLDQSLIVAMEDEARWMIANALTTVTTTPDFAQYVYVDGLKALKPQAVNVIR